MDIMNILIDLFNILIVLVFFFNLFNIYKIFYRKGKIKSFYGNNYKTIPDKFEKRNPKNIISIVFWSLAFLFSAYQWYIQKTTNFTELMFSVESFTLLSLSLATLRIFDTGAFSESRKRAHIFYDDKYFTVNPFDKLFSLQKHYWEDLQNFELVDSQYKNYIYVIINLKNGTKYRLIVTQDDKDKITKELTKHLSFYKRGDYENS